MHLPPEAGKQTDTARQADRERQREAATDRHRQTQAERLAVTGRQRQTCTGRHTQSQASTDRHRQTEKDILHYLCCYPCFWALAHCLCRLWLSLFCPLLCLVFSSSFSSLSLLHQLLCQRQAALILASVPWGLACPGFWLSLVFFFLLPGSLFFCIFFFPLPPPSLPETACSYPCFWALRHCLARLWLPVFLFASALLPPLLPLLLPSSTTFSARDKLLLSLLLGLEALLGQALAFSLSPCFCLACKRKREWLPGCCEPSSCASVHCLSRLWLLCFPLTLLLTSHCCRWC
jgi:hypothetical protein